MEPLDTRRSLLVSLSNNAINFCLGGIAGAFGATTVYPIDLGGFDVHGYTSYLSNHRPSYWCSKSK